MANHTPGPWVAHKYGVRDSGGYICELRWPSLYTGQDERYFKETAERLADARLIAAAPDLLEALLIVKAGFDKSSLGISAYAYQTVVDAITKATATDSD